MSWLADLGRSSYVSQRGLADTLKKLQEAGKLDANAATSRGSIKRARDTELQNMTTRFGPLLQQVSLQGSSSKKYAVSMINPVALWTHCGELFRYGHPPESSLSREPTIHWSKVELGSIL